MGLSAFVTIGKDNTIKSQSAGLERRALECLAEQDSFVIRACAVNRCAILLNLLRISMSEFVFSSTVALERELDGSDEGFHRYFYALYNCSPDQDNAINQNRQRLQEEYPDKAVAVGKYFVLWGEAAAQALRSYYSELAANESLDDDFRGYANGRLQAIERRHLTSQGLSVPIDLSEGQLSKDDYLDFYTCIALSNGQVVVKTTE
tara:strand:- start:987 stop:1601 length:615 start_codon:yes stop_codon:yes gene_type:complete